MFSLSFSNFSQNPTSDARRPDSGKHVFAYPFLSFERRECIEDGVVEESDRIRQR